VLVTTDLEFVEVQVSPALAVQLPCQCAPDPPSIGAAMHAAFDALGSFVARHGLSPNGQPRAIYTAYGAGGVSFIVALPVVSGPPTAVDEPPIRVDTLDAIKAYRFTHHGPYADLAKTYNRITAFMKEKGWMQSEADWMRYMPMWEEYLNDPEKTPAEELATYIYLPVA
jgi:effector-binding domain-containing protein